MSWLDELGKDIVELKTAWELEKIPNRCDYTDLVPAQVTTSSLIFAVQSLDRLMVIVKAAEYFGGKYHVDGAWYNCCPCCGAFQDEPHESTCPYSDEYKGGK